MREVTGKLKGRLMRTNTKRCDVTHRQIGSIGIEYTVVDDFTIVEITHDSKHYHGLAKLNDRCDTWDEDTGVVIAFRRAFDLMMEDVKPSPPIGYVLGCGFGSPLGMRMGKSYTNPCQEMTHSIAGMDRSHEIDSSIRQQELYLKSLRRLLEGRSDTSKILLL